MKPVCIWGHSIRAQDLLPWPHILNHITFFHREHLFKKLITVIYTMLPSSHQTQITNIFLSVRLVSCQYLGFWFYTSGLFSTEKQGIKTQNNILTLRRMTPCSSEDVLVWFWSPKSKSSILCEILRSQPSSEDEDFTSLVWTRDYVFPYGEIQLSHVGSVATEQ